MLYKLIEFSLKNRLLVVLIFLIITFLGYKSYKTIPIDAFPDITPKQVVIYTESSGNSAEDIEKLVTYPLESALAGLSGVKKITSNSLFGLSYISVFFEDSYDIYFLRQQVSERIQSVDIPQGFGKPILGPNTTGLGQVFWYQLEDKEQRYSLQSLREIQEYYVKPILKSVKGVEEVISWGGFQKQFEIVVESRNLERYKLNFKDLIDAIKNANCGAGGQYLEFNSEQYLIRGVGFYKNIEDIKNTFVKSVDGRVITLEDVAEVKVGNQPRFGAVTINTKESVFGMVLQKTATDANMVVKGLKEKIKIVNNSLPEGIKLKTIYDRTDITKKALSTINQALLSGVVLVIIILFIFLFEFRSALIVISSLPLSLLIAYFLMDTFSLTANLMSLSGLAIAIGMIVDATIVMVENSYTKLNANSSLSKYQVILLASKEVVKPITFAVLIIIAVFLPLLTLDGLAGKLYTPMAKNILFVMIGSLLVAIFLIPILNLLFLKSSKSNKNPFTIYIKKFYMPILNLTFRYSKVIFIATTTLFSILIFLLSMQGREFMPSLNEESIMFRVIAPPSTALSTSVNYAKDIEKKLLKNYSQSIDKVVSMIGRSEKGETAQANYMEILLVLKNTEDLDYLTKNITEFLHKNFDSLRFIPTQPIAMRIEELLEGVQSELAIKIYGDDQKTLNKIAKDIAKALDGLEGLKELEAESQIGQNSIVIKPNYQKIAKYGINVKDIMELIRIGMGEEAVSFLLAGVKKFPIVVKLKDIKSDIDTLKDIRVVSSNGSIVTLEEICDIQTVSSSFFIKRENLKRYMVLGVESEDIDVETLVKNANKRLKELKLPSGYYFEWVGEYKNLKKATDKLLFIIPTTIMIILLLLYLAFNSFKKMALISVSVPFGLIGGIIALIFAKVYLSVSAVIGFLAIFAIAVLNGIVLVSFIDDLREKYPQKELKSVIKDATLLRLRPVLMTAFTTLLGIFPLLFSSGVGSEIQYPLAVVIVGGIVSSTILTLLLLPVGYFEMYRSK